MNSASTGTNSNSTSFWRTPPKPRVPGWAVITATWPAWGGKLGSWRNWGNGSGSLRCGYVDFVWGNEGTGERGIGMGVEC